MGAVGIIPGFHHILRYGYTMSLDSFAVHHIAQEGLLYLIGAFIYASRIPERYFPGKLDIIGHSHQIWHLFVLAAAASHYEAVLHLSKWWHEHNHKCEWTDQDMISWFI